MFRYKLTLVLFGQGLFMFFSHELSKSGHIDFLLYTVSKPKVNRVRIVLKVLEFYGGSLKSPWIAVQSLNLLQLWMSGSWKCFYTVFWLSNHSSEKVKVNLHKVFFVFTKINSQFKGSGLKSVEKLLEQTVQAFKSC